MRPLEPSAPRPFGHSLASKALHIHASMLLGPLPHALEELKAEGYSFPCPAKEGKGFRLESQGYLYKVNRP